MGRTVRGAIGVVAGAIGWMAGFYALVALLVVAWPAFRAPAQTWQTEFVFNFTSVMACLLLLSWALAAVAGGWIAAKVGKQPWTIWVLAGLLEIYVVTLHVVLYWSTFPWWYNLGVVIPVIPAILVGASLAGKPHAELEGATAIRKNSMI